MKKSLRLTMMSTLLLIAGNVMAQKTVTIDFDNDYQTLFPTIPGLSSQGSNDGSTESSNDGDFTGATTSTAVDGVTVTVTPADDAKTPSRLWNTAPRLRMYSGTFTVTANEITKIEFTGHSTNFNLEATVGTLDGKKWVGNANEVVFNVTKNTQINKIVVTIGGETEVVDPNKKGSENNPYTVAEAQEFLSTLGVNQKSDAVFVKGYITAIDEVDTGDYGNATYYINDSQSTDGQLYVFRGYYLENKHFTASDQIKVGDQVVVTGQLVNYRSTKAAETDPFTPEFTQGNYIYSLNGKTTAEDNPQPVDEVKQVSVEQALDIINEELEDGKSTSENYRVVGFVVGTPDFQRKADGSLYGNVNFEMADNQNGQPTITVFRAKSFDNVSFDEETISLLKEGDEVVVEGKLQRDVNKDGVMTPEISNCHIYAINGNTGSVSSVVVSSADSRIYNVAGQRVEKAQGGLFIVGGKKVIVK